MLNTDDRQAIEGLFSASGMSSAGRRRAMPGRA